VLVCATVSEQSAAIIPISRNKRPISDGPLTTVVSLPCHTDDSDEGSHMTTDDSESCQSVVSPPHGRLVKKYLHPHLLVIVHTEEGRRRPGPMPAITPMNRDSMIGCHSVQVVLHQRLSGS
jgi:hypothetical protein